MRVAGIDYSIRSPAACVFDTENEFTFDNLKFMAIPENKKLVKDYGNIEIIQNLGSKRNNIERFDHLATNIVDFLLINRAEKVLIEDYAFAARGGRVFHIGENGGILKYKLYQAGIDIETIAPTSLKKFAFGKGNAKKEDMVGQFQKETGVDLWKVLELNNTKKIPSPIDDIADAYFLVKYLKGEQDDS